jgi:hypothetical protein
MAEERFDLSYRGDLVPGADPARVRERLTAIFKLSDAGGQRLFTGRPVIVKRDADAETRTRYEAVFRKAGAVLRVTEVAASDREPLAAPTSDPDPSVSEGRSPPGSPGAPLALSTQGGFLEEPRTVNIAAFETGELSLVAGQDWSLADCEPPPTPIPIPDIGYLSLAEMEPRAERPGLEDPRNENKTPPE